MQETCIQSLDWEDPLEKGIASHSSILAWRIPWTEEPGGWQSVGLQRVRYAWQTNTQGVQYTFLIYTVKWLFSLVSQMVKYLPAMQETEVQSLGQELPLEQRMATQSNILAWRIPWKRKKSDKTKELTISTLLELNALRTVWLKNKSGYYVRNMSK